MKEEYITMKRENKELRNGLGSKLELIREKNAE